MFKIINLVSVVVSDIFLFFCFFPVEYSIVSRNTYTIRTHTHTHTLYILVEQNDYYEKSLYDINRG